MVHEESRMTGISVLSDVPWGTHLCQFFENEEDLLEILVPYVKAGLEHNEYCVWITGEPLYEEAVTEAMRAAVPDFDDYLRRGQLELIPDDQWYLEGGSFDPPAVLHRWVLKLEHAMNQGYAGLRACGNSNWMQSSDWDSLARYEEEISGIMSGSQAIAICTYDLSRLTAAEVMEAVGNHHLALVRQHDRWQVIENSERKRAEKQLGEFQIRYRLLFEESSAPVLVIDTDGNYIAGNQAALEFLECTRQELPAMNVRDLTPPGKEEVLDEHRSLWSTGGVIETDYLVRGRIKTLQLTIAPTRWEGREAVIGIGRDVTGEKQAAEALRRSEERFRLVAESMRDAVFLATPDGRTIYVSPSYTRLLGYTLEEAAGMGLQDLLTPSSAEAATRRMAALAGTRYDERAGDPRKAWPTLEYRCRDGSIIQGELGVTPLWDSHGRLAGIAGVIHDVTEQRKAEEALRLSEERHRSLYSAMTEGMAINEMVYDEAGNPVDSVILDVNPAYEFILGLKRDEVLGRRASEVYRTGEWTKNLDVFARVAQTGHAEVFDIYYASVNRHFNISAFRPGGSQVAMLFTDITERKHSEEHILRQSLVLNAINGLLMETLSSETVQELSKTCLAKCQELTGSPLGWIGIVNKSGRLDNVAMSESGRTACRIPETEAPMMIENMDFRGLWGTVLRTGEPVIANDPASHPESAGLPEGHPDLTAFLGVPLKDGTSTIGMIGLANKEGDYSESERQDIEALSAAFIQALKRKRAEEALEGSRREFAELYDSAPFGYFTADNGGHIQRANRKMAEILGHHQAELPGLQIADFFAESLPERVESIRSLISDGAAWKKDVPVRTSRGDSMWVNLSMEPACDGTGHVIGARGTMEDITERKQAEERIEHLNRVLRAIRNVNQLLVHEKDPYRVIQQACYHLVEQQGYTGALAILTDERSRPRAWARAGFDESFDLLAGELRAGKLPPCCERAARHLGTYHVTGLTATCLSCPIAQDCLHNDGMCIRLEHEDTVYGYLVVALEQALGRDEEEQSLFEEVAGDIAFGLHSIAMEEKRRQAEEALAVSEAKYRDLYDYAPVAYYSVGIDGRIRDSNQAAQRWLGYSEDELIGMRFLDIYDEASRTKAESLFERFRRGEVIANEEIVYRHRDGHKLHGLLSVSAIRDAGGRMIASRSVVEDITELRRANETILRNQKHLEDLLELHRLADSSERAILDFVLSASAKSLESPFAYVGTLNADESIMTVHGWSTGVMAECAIRVHPMHFPVAEAGLWGEVVRQRIAIVVNDEASRHPKKGYPEGHVPITRFLGVPVFAANRIVAVAAVANKESGYDETDVRALTSLLQETWGIFERKRMQEALEISESRYRTVARLSSNFAYSCVQSGDGQHRIDWITDAFYALTGYSDTELMEHGCWMFVTHPDDAEQAKEPLRRLKPGEADTREFRIVTKEGRILYITNYMECHADAATPQGLRLFGAVKEITERKQAEEALRSQERYFRTLIENSSDAVAVLDATGRLKYVSPSIKRVLGYDPEAITGKSIADFLQPDDLEHMLSLFELLLAEPGAIASTKAPFPRNDGSQCVIEATATNLLDQPHVAGIVVNYRDITRRKRAERALRESEAKYATLIEQSLDGVVVVQDWKMVFVNPAHAVITGYSREEMLGSRFINIVAPDFRQEVARRDRAWATGERFPQVMETPIICKDGTIKSLESSVATIRYEGKPAAMIMLRDITERRQLEAERQRSAKQESVGTLAGGIAHDFNNLLAGILGNVTLARNYIEPGSEAHEVLVEAEKASLRAKGLTQQLLTYAKGGSPIRELASVTEVIKDSATFALRGSRTRADFDLPSDLWPAEIDAGQISQVITNLVINADEAMPKGGTIRIEARNRIIDESGPVPLKKGNYVEISVADEGVGIPSEFLDRLFEPYFTTKQKGSGLGLATAYSIVKSHEGHVTVDSQPGTGATFHTWLPASRERLKRSRKPKATRRTGRRAKKRVLIMDDEEMLRNMLSRMLSLAGYEVEAAGDGAEAIELYARARESGQPFAAVILDLTVPGGMGGLQAVQKLLEIDPDVKAIVSSGYSSDPIMSEFKKYGFSAVVAKPYSLVNLQETLEMLMAENPKSTIW